MAPTWGFSPMNTSMDLSSPLGRVRTPDSTRMETTSCIYVIYSSETPKQKIKWNLSPLTPSTPDPLAEHWLTLAEHRLALAETGWHWLRLARTGTDRLGPARTPLRTSYALCSSFLIISGQFGWHLNFLNTNSTITSIAVSLLPDCHREEAAELVFKNV